MDLINYLEKLDLTKKQAKVYLACLELGSAPANEIAKKSGLVRTTAYNILQQLVDMNFINCLEQKSKKIYSAELPAKMLELWKNKQEKIKNQENTILQILPYLNSVYNRAEAKPRIKLYQGRQGIRTIFDEVLIDKPEFLYYTNSVKTAEEIVGERFFYDWIKKRIKLKIFSKGIRVKRYEVKKKLYTGSDKDKFLREVRWAPDNFEIPMIIMIYGHKVALISSTKELFGFVVESQDFATLMKNFFDLLWQASQK